MINFKDKILIVTCHYLNLNNGGSLGSKAYINAFARIFDKCVLIYPDNEVDVKPYLSVNIELIPCKDNRNKIQKAIDVYLGKLHRFRQIAIEYIKTNKPEYILFDHSITSGNILKVAKQNSCKIITIHHNVETEYLKDNKPIIPIRLPFFLYMEKIEYNALNYSDLNLTVTNEDAIELDRLYNKNNAKIHYWGTFEHPNIVHKLAGNTSKKNRFVITGNLSFEQSYKSIISFIETYYSALLEIVSDAKLIIAGRNPNKDLIKCCSKYENIDLIPNPADMSEVIDNVDYYVCPVDMGGGVKLRVADGLKAGLPVIAHKVSSRGYEMFRKYPFFNVYDDLSSFRQAVEITIGDTYKKEDILDLYLNRFSFESGLNRLENILIDSGLI
jgi:hypothetical protein